MEMINNKKTILNKNANKESIVNLIRKLVNLIRNLVNLIRKLVNLIKFNLLKTLTK